MTRSIEMTFNLADIPPDLLTTLYGADIAAQLLPQPELYVAGTLADLYGMPQVETFSLYGVDPHCDCVSMEFCRNPLHPGPCKGWKRTLGAVAPGALHALEKDRLEKAEKRRVAAIKRHQDAGRKVPARLLKPITSKHLAPQAGAGGANGPGGAPPGGFQKPAGATRAQIDQKVAARRADVAEIGKTSFLSKKASDRLDVYRTLKDGDVKAMTPAQRNALEGDLTMMVAKFKDPQNKATAERIQKQVGAVPKSPAQAAAPSAPSGPVDRKGQGVGRDGDGDGKKNEKKDATSGASAPAAGPAPATPAAAPKAVSKTPTGALGPSQPLPATASPAAKLAHATANRSAARSRLSKGQVDAYSKLDKADYDALPDDTKDQIKQDLAAAHNKFLDPKKKAEVADLQKKLGIDGGQRPAAAAPVLKPSTPAAPSAPSTPAAPQPPSDESIHAMDAIDQIALVRHGNRLSDAALKRGAKQLDEKTSAERAEYLRKFADEAAAGLAQQVETRALVKLTPEARKKLADDMHEYLTGGKPGLTYKHVRDAIFDPNKGSVLNDHLVTEKLATGHGLEKEIADVFTASSPTVMAGRIDDARYAARGAHQEAAVQAMLKQVMADKSLASWVRARAARNTDEWKMHKLNRNSDVHGALNAATQGTNSRGEFQPNGQEAGDLFRIKPDVLADLPEPMQEAIKDRRGEAVESIYRNTTRGGAQREDFLLGLNNGHPSVVGSKLDGYNELTDTQKGYVQDMLGEKIENDIQRGIDPPGTAAWLRLLDDADGTKYNPAQRDAIDASISLSSNAQHRLSEIEKLSQADYASLPDAYALGIEHRLEAMATHTDPDVRVRSALKLGELRGTMPDHSNPKTQAAALSAGLLWDVQDPKEKHAAFTKLSAADFAELSPAGKLVVPSKMQTLVNDPNSGLSLQDRGGLQLKYDQLTGKDWDTDPLVAAMSSVMDTGKLTEQQRIDAYDKLTWTDYDAMPRFFRGTISDDLERLKTNDPMAYDRIKQRIDPSHVPAATVTPASNQPPHVAAALDVVYGVDAKSKQAPHQMKVYGGLKASDFGTLGPQEQNVILSDLSYIETTSKSADSKARARKLIDRFTPSGTPLGTQPPPMIIPPASAVSNQTRLPDPTGVPGLLKESTNPGKRGDEWMTTTNGKTRVWGKYGAAGLMVRHVDPQTGEERFLIAQRGRAISDPGKWQLPGGAMESLESAHEGATRETREELGLNASHFKDMRVHGHHEAHVANVSGTPTGDWKYTSIAATTTDKFTPDLSAPGARAETSDAKWMTRAEIEQLDKDGKLIGPLAGGKLQQNIMSLFPSAAHATGPTAPGPVTKRPARLDVAQRGQLGAQGHPGQPSGWNKPHKQSKGKNLAATHTDQKALSKQISPIRKNFRGKSADERLAAIGEIQGFNDTPTVVTKAEMDRLLATGDYIEGWRGVSAGGGKSAAQIAEEFRTGPSWYGTGIFGNGYYIATQKSVAEQYAGRRWGGNTSDGIVRVLIPKDSVTTTWEDAHKESKNAYSSNGGYQYTSRRANGTGTFHDEGRLAAAQGKDGIVISHRSVGPGGHATHIASAGKPSYNWLNRSVLIVQEA